MRDGVALLAILARVRRRLRALAAIEGAVVGAAAALAALAVAVIVARWRGTTPSPRGWRLEIAAAVAVVASGAIASALRRIPLDRCARFVDGAIDRTDATGVPPGGSGVRHDRVLSALAFARATADARVTPFLQAAIGDAVDRAATIAPGAAAPLRRPRATPAFAAAAFLLAVGALSPLPARGSRTPLSLSSIASGSATGAVVARVRLAGRALDPEREQAAEALRAAGALGDPELAGLARALAATVTDLSNRGLDPAEALDRLGDLLRRADQAAQEVAALPHALEQAGSALQATAATRDSGLALIAEDSAATERAMNDLAARAAQAADGERNRIAAGLDRAGDRVGAMDDARALDGKTSPAGPTPGDGRSPSESGASLTTATDPSSAAATDDDAANERNGRRLARDDPRAAHPPSSSLSTSGAGAARQRRLQRLQRELKETASACRTDPEACRQKLQRQAHELPRMEDEARSLAPRQRLAEAVRQLRDRLRREGNGAGERAREERRFLRSARGENARGRSGAPDQTGQQGTPVLSEDPDGVSDEGDDSDGESADNDGAGSDGTGDGAQAAESDGDPGGASAGEANAGKGTGSEESANGDGIGNQKGGDPLGERGAMTTRGHAREAAVKDGAGPTRSQVIQSAARRGFAHTSYQNVFTDYQAVVEESLDGSAVPPGRRYIVRRYFQLIRPQSPRATR